MEKAMSERLRKVVHDEISKSHGWSKNGDSWGGWLKRVAQPSSVISFAAAVTIFVAGGKWYAVASQVEQSTKDIQRVIETVDDLAIRVEADKKMHTKELEEIKEKLEDIEDDLQRTNN